MGDQEQTNTSQKTILAKPLALPRVVTCTEDLELLHPALLVPLLLTPQPLTSVNKHLLQTVKTDTEEPLKLPDLNPPSRITLQPLTSVNKLQPQTAKTDTEELLKH